MGIDIGNINWNHVLEYVLAVVISISFHEFGHAFASVSLGDERPRRDGRLTLLPTEHFDPLGFLMIVVMALGGMGLGWGKPVMVNPGAWKHPRRDNIIVSAAGPFMNLLLAIATGLGLRFLPVSALMGLGGDLLQVFLFTNLALMFFNLIPIPPLDGSHILSSLLPYELADRYDRTMGAYGPMILLALVFLGGGILGHIIGPPMMKTASLIVGPRLWMG